MYYTIDAQVMIHCAIQYYARNDQIVLIFSQSCQYLYWGGEGFDYGWYVQSYDGTPLRQSFLIQLIIILFSSQICEKFINVII